jgi:hypothetical protein
MLGREHSRDPKPLEESILGQSAIPSRRERHIVLLWSVLMCFIVAAPICHGYKQAKEGHQFVGFVGRYHSDFYSYLAWIRQAYDGHVLFKDMFTTEPHSRVFFHPLFWFIGSAARLTGTDVMAVCYVMQLFGCVLMIFGIYWFCAAFTGDIATRMLAMVLTTTASGFGWMMTVPSNTPLSQLPIDLWLNVANQFQAAVTSFFTLPIAMGLMMWAMVWFLRYLNSGRLRDSVIAGLFALALTATHQYDIVTVYAVLGLWTVMQAPRRLLSVLKKPVSILSQPPFAGMLLLVAVSISFALYSLAIVQFHPVLSKVEWSMPPPTFMLHILGWGLPLLVCIAGLLFPSVWRQNRRVELLVGWLLINIVLLLLPIDFRRKLIWGMHVPMCLLAAMAVVALLRAMTRPLSNLTLRAGISITAAAIVAVFCAIGSWSFYSELFKRNTLHLFEDYLPNTFVDALKWLDNNSDHSGVVIAGPAIAMMIPGRTGNTVFEGHWAQTLDRAGKRRFTRVLFSPNGLADLNMIHRVLARNNVRFIVLDTVTARQWRLPIDTSHFPFSPLVDPVFQNGSVYIWEVKGYQADLDTEPWPSGNWFGPEGEDLSAALAAQSKYTAAYNRIQNALKLSPENPTLYYRLGNLYKDTGQFNAAIALYQKALSVRPEFVQALENLAVVYADKQEYDNAISSFKEIIRLSPDNAGVYYNIACMYAKQNQGEKSIQWLKKALSKGYSEWERIKTDKDLENIKNSPEYYEIIKDH